MLVEKLQSVLRESSKPLTFQEIAKKLDKLFPKSTKKNPQPPKPTEEEIRHALNEEVQHQRAFEHPGTAKSGLKYWHAKPPSMSEVIERTVREKVAGMGDTPVLPARLGKPTMRQGVEALQAFERILNQLVEQKQLFVYPGGKLGRVEPPKPNWYETAPFKAEFDKLVKAAKKITDFNTQTLDDVIAALRLRLKPVASVPPPVPVPPPVVTTPPANLRDVLKQAYDYLCLFVEFRDKLVELPRLYHEIAKRFPGLTVEAFQNELWQMNTEWKIELHVLNEVHAAKEPHLAIHRNDRLYYYVIWK